MATENCDHGHAAPRELLEDLHESQAGTGRHKCCVCAYAEGLQVGRTNATMPGLGDSDVCQVGNRASRAMLDALPESQAGEARHKCTVCAYHAGFYEGRRFATR